MMRDRMTRREFLRAGALGALGLGAAGCGGGSSGPPAPGDDGFSFAMFCAMHYRGPEDEDYLSAGLRYIAAHREIEFSLIAGDIAETGREERLQGVKDLLPLLERPAYLVRGDQDNHAGAGTWGRVFGDRHVSFTHKDVLFLGVDSTNGTGQVTNVVMPEDTLEWAQEHLPADPATPVVMFTHFPLIDAGKPVDETPWSRRGRPLNAHELLSVFDGYRLLHVLCDHWRAVVSDTETRPGTVITTNRCLSPWKLNHDASLYKGFYHCTYRDGAVRVEFRRFSALTAGAAGVA